MTMTKMKNSLSLLVLFCMSVIFATTTLSAADDILIADFEGDEYAPGWKTAGSAFGTGPAKGTLPNQMEVRGYLGKGLVNSYHDGDDSLGRLTSPVFKIERPYISFLIGGGGHEELGIRLFVDDRAVRIARGPNVVPGGSETLEWADWDVSEFIGREGHIEIFDSGRGSWGHINIDHIIQTETKRAPVTMSRVFTGEKDFMHIPISMKGPMSWIRVEVDGEWTQEFDCRMTVSGDPDFYVNLYIGNWKGKKIELIAEKTPSDSKGLSMVVQDEKMAQEDTVYKEKLRPQFHFSARTGWINDPNGLVYYEGVWHIFFQHNPYSTDWGNMTWGHATSTDLFHWTEHPAAIQPDKLGTIFSGSGVVDRENTSGFQKGEKKPLVFFYTYQGPSARFGKPITQGMAYSSDGGKTFEKYEKNPIIPHILGGNRDPKVIWHEESKQWILALYMDGEDYALFGSANLKEWKMLCEIKNLGCSECPDFFPLAVDGGKKNLKWVFWGGNGKYLLGSFDGKEFKPETKPLTNKYGGNDYAAMTFSDAPNGRRIQLSWMNTWGDNTVFRGMPFNHQFSVPRELTLRTTPQGKLNLYMEPVEELEKLRGKISETSDLVVKNGEETLIPAENELLDIELKIKTGDSQKLVLDIRGRKIEYDATEKRIALDGIKAPLELADGVLDLRVVLDRTSIEIFAQGGEVQICKVFRPKADIEYKGILIKAEGGNATLENAKIWPLKSVWNNEG